MGLARSTMFSSFSTTCGPRNTVQRFGCKPVSHRSHTPRSALRILNRAGMSSTASTGKRTSSSSSIQQARTNGFKLAQPPAAAGAASQQAAEPPLIQQPLAAIRSNSSSSSRPPNPTTNTNTSSSASRADRHHNQSHGKTAVIVGGGWAGFGAALALVKAGAEVTLLDAAESPGGLSSTFRSAGGQVVEPGIKGFWYQYNNIEALVTKLGIPDPFTPYTKSSFWSPEGLQVESPVFQDLPLLPTPLGSFVHTAPLFRNLSLLDRATAVPLVKPLLEHDLDEAIYRHYDSMSAYELFKSAGLSSQLYDKFLVPMLLVTLFAPPTELSAAAALGALYYFALAHQPDFDVRWCKGPIGQTIFEPLVQHLKTLGVRVLGSRRVQDILPAKLINPGPTGSSPKTLATVLDPALPRVVAAQGPEGLTEHYDADVIVLAAGVPALQRLVMQSRVLASAEDLRGVLGVGCSDVLAVRLWLDQKLELRSSSNVVAGFDEGVGGTFFHLNELQDMYKSEPGSVIEFDLYHAESLLPLSDDAIITHLLQTYLAPALPRGLEQAKTLTVQDSSVLRVRNAVTRFSPGSHLLLPDIVTSIPNVFVAGDCVKQGPGAHGCKGLSQEKAYVSGLQAGNHAAARLGLTPVARVLPVEPDEPHVTAAKDLLRLQRLVTSAVFEAHRQFSDSQQQQQGMGPGASTISRSVWAREQNNSERRAVESHELRKLLRDEMAQQVSGQQQQQLRQQLEVTA